MKRIEKSLNALLLATMPLLCGGDMWSSPDAPATRKRVTRESTAENLTKAAHRACISPGRRANRIYRRPDRTLAHWNAEAMWTQPLENLPAGTPAQSNGVIRHEGALYVPWENGMGAGAARVIREGAGYRIRLDNGDAGPRVVRRPDNRWELAGDENNYARGSVLADLLADEITVDPRMLQRAASIMEVAGLPESTLQSIYADAGSTERLMHAKPLILLSMAQAFFETLSSRLRDPRASVWSEREVRLLGPDMATYLNRPLAIYRTDGTPIVAIGSDGGTIHNGVIPDDAFRLVRDSDGNFSFRDEANPTRYPSIFAAAEAGTRPASDLRMRDASTREYEYRAGLAEYIDGRRARPALEHAIRHWIDPLVRQNPKLGPATESLARVARLRQAIFDKHHALTAAEERRFLEAARNIMPRGHAIAIEVVERTTGRSLTNIETLPARARIVIKADLNPAGERVAYYQDAAPGHSPIPSRPIEDQSFSPLIDVLLNTDNGQVRKALALGEWDFRIFADRLLENIVTNENALLPPSLGRFVSRDAQVLADAETRLTDDWWLNDRHFVRLRHLDGRTQIVETKPVSVDGGYELLGFGEGLGMESSRLTSRSGKWYPPPLLRMGFNPTSSTFRESIVTRLERTLPPGSPVTRDLLERIVDETPYPILIASANVPSVVEVSPSGELILATGTPPRHRRSTRIYLPTASAQPPAPVQPPTATAPPRPATPLSIYRQHLAEEPALHGATPTAAPAQALPAYLSLVAAGAPVGDFVQSRVGSRHIQALVTSRRLRTMLRSDEYIVVVAGAVGHAVSMILPANNDSLQLIARGYASMGELPAGTRIIDDWLGTATTATEYPARLRTFGQGIEANNDMVTVRDGDAMVNMTGTRFAEEILSRPLIFNQWSPAHDPIQETHYFSYVQQRHTEGRPATPAGFDWLQTAEARNEIARYFTTSTADPVAVSGIESLTGSAVALNQNPHAEVDPQPIPPVDDRMEGP